MRIIELLENDFYLLSFINAPRHISVLKVTIQNQHQNKSAAGFKSSAEMY